MINKTSLPCLKRTRIFPQYHPQPTKVEQPYKPDKLLEITFFKYESANVFLKKVHYMIRGKGVSFYRNCGATSVGVLQDNLVLSTVLIM